jgi:hypothetical protein
MGGIMGTTDSHKIQCSLRLGGAVLVVAGLVTVFHPQPAQASSCLYPDRKTGAEPSYSCLKPGERALVDLRKFRAEMTVAALRCDQQGLYNKVVRRHQSELVTEGKALGATFRRLHGASATHELNRFVTHLTNRASMQSLNIRNYCSSMSDVFTQALKVPLKGLMAFVGTHPLTRALAQHTAPEPVRVPAINIAEKTAADR